MESLEPFGTLMEFTSFITKGASAEAGRGLGT